MASTLALWIMFVVTIPQFADKIAPVHSTHKPEAFFTVSLIALLTNLVLFAYQSSIIIKKKKNPFKDEIYAETKTYKNVIAENV
jgi:hypothetical protein